MKKEFILILVIVLAVVGGVWYLGQKQSQNPSPTNVMPTENLAVTTTPQNTVSSTSSLTKIDESKNQISLTVSQPVDGQTTTSSSITVRGKTSPNADVTVNDVDLKADAQGNFSTTVTLDEGDNDIIIIAIDDKGLSAEKDLRVTLDTGQQYE